MIHLVLSILCASLIFLIFRYFYIYKVQLFQAIIINYISAAAIGFFIVIDPPNIVELLNEEWFFLSLGIGAAFIGLFNLMAWVTQKMGASVASVAVKMAVVIPICIAFILYDDSIGILKLAGILMALLGIYLASIKPKSSAKINRMNILLLISLFIGSGLLDSIMKYSEEIYLSKEPSDIMKFTACIFFFAAFFGIIILLIKSLIKNKKPSFAKQDFLWGIILGIVNYGSIFFLLSALNQENWESSMVFPINNMGIVALTTLASVIIFKEKLYFKNILGIFISIIAIALIAFS